MGAKIHTRPTQPGKDIQVQKKNSSLPRSSGLTFPRHVDYFHALFFNKKGTAEIIR